MASEITGPAVDSAVDMLRRVCLVVRRLVGRQHHPLAHAHAQMLPRRSTLRRATGRPATSRSHRVLGPLVRSTLLRSRTLAGAARWPLRGAASPRGARPTGPGGGLRPAAWYSGPGPPRGPPYAPRPNAPTALRWLEYVSPAQTASGLR